MRIALTVASLLFLASCTQIIQDPVDRTVMAKCHYGLMVSFCVVANPKNHAVVSNSGVLPSTTTVLMDATVGDRLLK